MLTAPLLAPMMGVMYPVTWRVLELDPPALVAVMVIGKVPVPSRLNDEAVPEISPVEVFRDQPEGSPEHE
jgi:hypothetical protein